MIFKMGGKEFLLKPFTGNQFIELEDMGFNMLQSAVSDGGLKFSIKHLRAMLYVAIKMVDSSVTLEWVGEHLFDVPKEQWEAFSNFVIGRQSVSVISPT